MFPAAFVFFQNFLSCISRGNGFPNSQGIKEHFLTLSVSFSTLGNESG